MSLADDVRIAQRNAGEQVVIDNLKRISTPAGGREERLDSALPEKHEIFEAQVDRLMCFIEDNKRTLAEIAKIYEVINAELLRVKENLLKGRK